MAIADKVILSYIDAWVDLVKNVYKIASECSGLMLASAVALIAIFSGLAFAIPILLAFPLIYGLMFGWLMTFAIDGLVETETAMCTNVDE